jgi:four helix bundle protein
MYNVVCITEGKYNLFYTMAHGSLTELQNQLVIARDIRYICKDDFNKIAKQTIVVHKLITGLKKIKNK